MNDPKTIVIAQFFISAMMAFLMTGLFSVLHLGPANQALSEWGGAFVTAWPIAFVPSLGVGKLGFMIACMIRTRLA